MAVLGKVAGTMLKDNLIRNGVDLVIDSNLMYYDISNRRIGINTITPGNALTVNGSVTASNIYINNTSITALNGNLILNSLTGNINASTLRIFNVVDPVSDQDAATKKYVDNNITAIASPNLYIGNLNSGNTNVVLNSETLYLIGNTNQINVAISSNSATFSLASNLVIGNLITTNGGQLTGYLTGAIGANTANTGVFTSVTTTSGGQLAGYLTGAIGANTANTGVFTSVSTTNGGQVTGYLTGAIGANTANTGAFTSITATLTAGIIGNLTAANITASGSGGQVTGYLTGAIGANTANSASFTSVTTSANVSTSAQFISTYAGSTANNGGQIVLNGATINRIDFPTGVSGLGDPNVTVRSPGTKIVLWPLVDGSGVDYAIGLTSGVLWNSVHDEARFFKWFANTTTVATLTGTGNFTVQNQLIGYHTGAIGANTANTGVFTSVTTTSGGQLIGYLTGAIGANTPNTGAFTSLTSTGNISGANISASGAGGQLLGYLTGAIGANTPNTGAFTSLTSTGNILGANLIVNGSGGQVQGYLTGAIGSNTANTGAFTSITATQTAVITGNLTAANITASGAGGQLIGYHTGAIGANVANTGAFTSISSSTANIGNLYIHNNTIDVINADGNINLNPVGNGIVSINSTQAILLPTGNNLARPLNPITGMFRYNTVLNSLEIWNGFDWVTVSGTATTTIVSDSFTGNGSDKNFTLSQSTTSSGALVSINGVSQIPGVSYTINDVTLTFVEAPLSTDVIEARMLTTTATTTSMVVGNSYVSFGSPANGYPFNIHVSSADRVIFYAANTSILNNLMVANAIVSSGSNISLTQNTLTTFDSFDYATYRTAKYIVSVSDFAGSKYQSAELIVNHNGTTASVTPYGIISTSGTNFVTFAASISGSNVILQANSTSSASYCKFQQTYVTV
jgi:hypothetical protein